MLGLKPETSRRSISFRTGSAGSKTGPWSESPTLAEKVQIKAFGEIESGLLEMARLQGHLFYHRILTYGPSVPFIPPAFLAFHRDDRVLSTGIPGACKSTLCEGTIQYAPSAPEFPFPQCTERIVGG